MHRLVKETKEQWISNLRQIVDTSGPAAERYDTKYLNALDGIKLSTPLYPMEYKKVFNDFGGVSGINIQYSFFKPRNYFNKGSNIEGDLYSFQKYQKEHPIADLIKEIKIKKGADFVKSLGIVIGNRLIDTADSDLILEAPIPASAIYLQLLSVIILTKLTKIEDINKIEIFCNGLYVKDISILRKNSIYIPEYGIYCKDGIDVNSL